MKLIETSSFFSTTRRLIKEDIQFFTELVKQSNNLKDNLGMIMFLPKCVSRLGEGGLRTQGYFKVGGIIQESSVIISDAISKPVEEQIVNDSHFSNYSNNISFGGEKLSSPRTASYEKNPKPLVTIITVVFNGELFLEETILSVIKQTYDNVEYIIIDGGSTDSTLEIIKKYENYIDYWVSEKDCGIYDAMNKGIMLAAGEWINFMNAGDRFFESDIIAEIFRNSYSSEVNVLYGDVETDYGDFKVKHKAGSLENLKYGMQFSHQSTFFKTQYHKQNKYNLSYQLSSDFYVIFNAYLNNTGFKYLGKVVSTVSTDGVSEKRICKSIIECWKIVDYSKFTTLPLNFYYFTKISVQFIKAFFVSKKALSYYRTLKSKL